MSRSPAALLLAGTLALSFALSSATADPALGLRVRVTEAMAPCLSAAARVFPAAPPLRAETGDLGDATADVLVGSGVEITRALESGAARDDSEVEIATIPWVLVLGDGAPSVKSLKDAVAAGLEVEVPGGPAAFEARRVLGAASAGKVRESDAAALRKAGVALVPLSLAGPGRRVPVDVPALVAQAAAGARSASPEAARAFLAFLGSEDGRRAFAACGGSAR